MDAATPPMQFRPAQRSWEPAPPLGPAHHGKISLGMVDLAYWDTGGEGEVIVMLHPFTGSNAIWGYQQAAFVEAGYRVIAYSRRGHLGSGRGPADDPGCASEDLDKVADRLGLDRFHLLGSAAGGFYAADYAAWRADRLRSLVIASSLGGGAEPSYLATTSAIVPKGFHDMPASFRELGPSYRAANPAGVAAWEALERQALTGERILPRMKCELTWATVSRFDVPALILTGDADLYMPPPRALEYASHLPGCEVGVIAEAGHSAYWEQPLAFNAVVLDFLARRGR